MEGFVTGFCVCHVLTDVCAQICDECSIVIGDVAHLHLRLRGAEGEISARSCGREEDWLLWSHRAQSRLRSSAFVLMRHTTA